MDPATLTTILQLGIPALKTVGDLVAHIARARSQQLITAEAAGALMDAAIAGAQSETDRAVLKLAKIGLQQA